MAIYYMTRGSCLLLNIEEISERKPFYEEPKAFSTSKRRFARQGSQEAKRLMEEYNSAVGVSGAILAAVCRGKLCEGIVPWPRLGGSL